MTELLIPIVFGSSIYLVLSTFWPDNNNQQSSLEMVTHETAMSSTAASNWRSTSGTGVPLNKSPYAKMSQYTSSTVDPTNGLSHFNRFGPNNNPQRYYEQFNGTRLIYSGFENKADTNLMYPRTGVTTTTNFKKKSSCCSSSSASTCCSSRCAIGIGVNPDKTKFFK